MSWATQGGFGSGPIVTPGDQDTVFDPNAFHDNVSGEYNGLTLATLANLDVLSIEDESAGFAKRKIVGSQILAPQAFMSGLATNWVSTSVVNVEPGLAKNIANNFVMELAATSTINFGTNGLGGLDTGSRTANTWYYGWLVGDSTEANPPGVIGSLASTFAALSPNLPAGYDRGRRVAAYRTNGANQLLNFNQYIREGLARVICYDLVEITSLQVLSGYGSLGYTTVNLGAYVPPVTVYPWLNMTSDSSSGTTPFVTIRPTGSTVSNPVQLARVFGEDSAFFWCRSNTSQQVDVQNSSSLNNTNLYVAGYRDHLLQ